MSTAVRVMTGPDDGEPRSEIRTFGTTIDEPKQARAWIAGKREGGTAIALL
jgi:hypothetical protein